MTLRELMDFVSLDMGIGSNELWSKARLTEVINQAQRIIQAELGFLLDNRFIAEFTENQPDVINFDGHFVYRLDLSSLSPICYVPNGVIRSGLDDAEAKELDYKDFSDCLKNQLLYPTIHQPIFTQYGNKLYVAPGDEQHDVKITYKYIIPDLSSVNDETQIPQTYIPLLLNKIRALIAEESGALDKMKVYEEINVAELQKFMGNEPNNLQSRNTAKMQNKVEGY